MARNVTAQSPYHGSLVTSPSGPAPSPVSAASSSTDAAAPSIDPITAAGAQLVAKAKPRPFGPVSREYSRCDLCGEQLGRNAGHFHMTSPLTARHVSVCRTCRRAALSEGYRPRA
jgi:hypothetical protein